MELHSQQINVPLVSVLMTAYNREKYIGQAIESVLASTFQDFELIIVDDGSKDKTVEIARQYSLKDQRVKLYINEKNLGDYPNRNQAASYAKGKYLKYVDADDLIYPWGLEILVHCMEKFPEAGWGLCSLTQDTYKLFPFELSPTEIYKYNFFGPGLFHKAPLSSIIKKEVFVSVNGFIDKQHYGDFDLWHILSLEYNLVLMPHGIVWYRSHDEQQSKDNRENPVISYKYFVAQLNFFNHCKSIPLHKKDLKRVKNKIISTLIRYMGMNLIRLRFFTFYSLLKALSNKNFVFRIPS